MERNKRCFDLGVAAFILVLASFLIYVSYHSPAIPVSSGLASMDFPRIVFALILLLSVAQLVLTVRWFLKCPAKSTREKKAPLMERKAALTAVLICLYAASWQFIGFTLSTLVYFFVQTKLLDSSKKTLRIVLVSLVVVAFIDLVFVLVFKVEFPEPLLELIRGY